MLMNVYQVLIVINCAYSFSKCELTVKQNIQNIMHVLLILKTYAYDIANPCCIVHLVTDDINIT